MKFNVGDRVRSKPSERHHYAGIIDHIRGGRVAPYAVKITESDYPSEVGQMRYHSGRDMEFANMIHAKPNQRVEIEAFGQKLSGTVTNLEVHRDLDSFDTAQLEIQLDGINKSSVGEIIIGIDPAKIGADLLREHLIHPMCMPEIKFNHPFGKETSKMSAREFTVDSKVRINDGADNDHEEGDIGTIVSMGKSGTDYPVRVAVEGKMDGYYNVDELELVDEAGEPVERLPKAFMLTKDTPDLKKGAVFLERCNDGTQPYDLVDKSFKKHSNAPESYRDREAIEQSTFFVEVYKVEPAFMTAEDLQRYEDFKKHILAKPAGKIKPVAKVDATRSQRAKSIWTPARRKAQSERMKKIRAARKGSWQTR